MWTGTQGFELREVIVLCSGPEFYEGDFDVVRPWMLCSTWERYILTPIKNYPLNALICLVKVFSCRWLDNRCGRACLCQPDGKFGITLIEPQKIKPPILLSLGNKGLKIKIPKAGKGGQHLLF